MLRSQSLSSVGQGPLKKHFCLGVPVCRGVESSQASENCSHSSVLRSKLLLFDRQGPAIGCFRLSKSLLLKIDVADVDQGRNGIWVLCSPGLLSNLESLIVKQFGFPQLSLSRLDICKTYKTS